MRRSMIWSACPGVLLSILLCASDCIHAEFENKSEGIVTDGHEDAALLSPERLATIPQHKIVDSLKIRPGMNIADIGVAEGAFSFLMADELKGTGMVYSTDIYKPIIDRLDRLVKGKGYKNITPVLLNDPFADQFYKNHSFDIIFISEVLTNIWKMEDYFRELRPSLVRGTGRLFIVEWRWVSPIHEIDISDFRMLLRMIAEKGPKFPIFKRLSKEVQDLILGGPEGQPTALIQNQIVNDLNAMLLDGSLFSDLVDYYYAKSGPSKTAPPIDALVRLIDPADVKYLRLLVVDADDSGALDKGSGSLSEIEKTRLLQLNKFLIFSLLKINSSFSCRQDLYGSYPFYRSKRSIISKVEAAGFKLVADHDKIPKYYFLEFKRSD